MKILNYFETPNQAEWTEKIRECDWGAAKLLADLLEQNRFDEVLGGGQLFMMTDGSKLVSFAALTKQDCIEDSSLSPWIGFVFTVPEYRGKRYSGQVIEHACETAKKQGAEQVYIATEHIGLYEKYGFEYVEKRTDIYGEDSRIYIRKL